MAMFKCFVNGLYVEKQFHRTCRHTLVRLNMDIRFGHQQTTAFGSSLYLCPFVRAHVLCKMCRYINNKQCCLSVGFPVDAAAFACIGRMYLAAVDSSLDLQRPQQIGVVPYAHFELLDES